MNEMLLLFALSVNISFVCQLLKSWRNEGKLPETERGIMKFLCSGRGAEFSDD